MANFKKWLSNYWYHYKWHTLIVLFFTVFLTVMIVQLATKGKEDIYIIYGGPELITDTQREEITDVFEQMMQKDYDGDGDKNVDFMDLILLNHDELKKAYENGANQHFLNEGTVENNEETLSVQAMAGDYVIFILGAEWYKDLHNAGAFLTFEEQAELGLPTDAGIKYDDCAYYLDSLQFAQFYTQFDCFPEDTLICIRRMSTASVIKGVEKTQKKYDRHVDYYKEILSFTLPEGYVPPEDGQ